MTTTDRTAPRDLRSELIAAAVAMLAEPQQIAVPSLRSIARACNVRPSAVYWHFPSEADLRSAVLSAEYSDLVGTIEHAIDGLPRGIDTLIAAGQAYVAWGLVHPGAYQLLFESSDPLPETLAEHGARLQNRIVELAAISDSATPFHMALLLWSAQHGIVSLRLHKTDWDWGMTANDAVARVVTAIAHNSQKTR